jgi:Na+/melibiose symporter-like transporter
MQKTAHSLSPFAIGIVLTSMGYVAGMKGGEQSAQAIQGVYIAISIVPAVALILSIPLLLMYKLTETELKRVGAA